VVTVAAAGPHEAHLRCGSRLLFRTQGFRDYQLPELSIIAIAVRVVTLLVLSGTSPGVVTLACLRASGRAGRERGAFPAGSPGALLVLPATGLLV
jgi:hypothetical protein